MRAFDIEFAISLLPIMFKYLKVTLAMSFLALLLALVLSFVIAMIINAKIVVLDRIAKIYIAFYRGTPLIAQLFFLYYGLAQVVPFIRDMNAFTAAVIGLAMNASAYMSESIRGAILSVDKGQMEAALSSGMTYFQGMRRIVFPQAFRIALPTLSNDFVHIVKGSSLAFALGVKELMAAAQLEGASRYRFLESYLAVIIFYWAIISILTYLQKKYEKKLSVAYNVI